MTAIKQFKVLHVKETTPDGNPDAGFLFLFPRDGKWWSRNSDGTEEMLGSVDFGAVSSIPAWNPATTYTLGDGDVYVLHKKKIWQLNAATSTNQEPGVSVAWEEVDFSKLSHLQNTDFKLGRDSFIFDGGGTQTFDLTTFDYAHKNYFHLFTDAGNNDATYTLRTVNGDVRKQGQFLVVVPVGATYVITFQENAHQKIGTTNLLLTGGDWALFEGDVNGKTALLASNKLQGGGGGSENPFDQSLNTTNSPQFGGLKLTGRTGTGTRAGTYAPDGTLTEADLKPLSDTVLLYQTYYDPVLGVTQRWGPINGVWTLIQTL